MIVNKRTKPFCFIRLFTRASIVSIFLIIALFPFSVHAFDILLGTGKTGSFSHFTGRTLCRMINRDTADISCKVVPAPSDVYNLTNLQGGSLDIVLIDSLMLHDAINKTGYFEFLDISYDNLRTVVPLYDVPNTLVARSDADISSLEMLKGKRVNAGAPRSPQHLVLDTIMKAKNWSKQDFRLIEELPASLSQDTMAFCHGTIQAMVHIGVHPDSSLQQLFRICEADLVNMDDKDIEKLVSDHPAFFPIRIARDMYPPHSGAVTTFGTRVALIASGDLDEQTVYKIINVIYSSQDLLRRSHPALSSFDVDKTEKNESELQLHPGAAKFFKDKGM